MLALPGPWGPPPWACSAAAATTFIPDSFYGFRLRVMRLNTPLERSGRAGAEGVGWGSWGVALQCPPSLAGEVWLCRVSARARGAAQGPPPATRKAQWNGAIAEGGDSEPLHGHPASPGDRQGDPGGATL